MQLRPYQSECVSAVFQAFQEHNSALAVLATGLGKTVVGAAVIRRWIEDFRGRILWLHHREELGDQAAEAIRRFVGCHVSIEMGQSWADEYGFAPSPVVVASVQTMARERRRRRFRPEAFGLIIPDEAHHAVARTYRETFDYFLNGNPPIKILGLTATPRRSDDLAMGQVFETCCYDYGIEPAVADGWLVPVRQAIATVADLDLSRVKVVAGDYAPGQLEAILTDPERKIVLKMTHPIVENVGDSQALVFTVGVKQAEAICDALNDRKPGSAAWVSGETDKEKRRRIVADFKAGRLQFMCNCGVFLEGFDSPATSWVIMARPTKSLSLYVQMLGRATRPLPGIVEGLPDAASRKAAIAASGKPWANVLDFVGNAVQHGPSATVTAADVLGGKYANEAKEYARKRLEESGNPSAIEEALDRADAELALLSEEEERRARIVADVDYRLRYLDSGLAGPQRVEAHGQRGEPATSKQVWKLISLGVARHKAERCTKAQARGWIGRLLAEQGRAS